MTAQARRSSDDRLAHAKQYARQTGRPLDDVLTAFGLDEPEIPDGGELLWEWFWEMASGRGSSGFGPQPLSWQDMVAWASISGIELQPWQAVIIRSMDRAWLAAVAEQSKKVQQKTKR